MMREREGEREKSNQTRSDQINTSNSRQDPSYFAKRHYCIRRPDNSYRLTMRNIHEPSFSSRRIPPTGVKWLVSNKYQSCQCRSLYPSTYLPTYLPTYLHTRVLRGFLVRWFIYSLVRLSACSFILPISFTLVERTQGKERWRVLMNRGGWIHVTCTFLATRLAWYVVTIARHGTTRQERRGKYHFFQRPRRRD